jgi:hypothetical protein
MHSSRSAGAPLAVQHNTWSSLSLALNGTYFRAIAQLLLATSCNLCLNGTLRHIRGCCKVRDVKASTSNALAQDAGLSATLAGTSEKATVFAPTDNAFSNLLTAIGLTAQQLLADPSTLGEARPALLALKISPLNANQNPKPSYVCCRS